MNFGNYQVLASLLVVHGGGGRLRRSHQHSLGILGALARLKGEFLDDRFVLVLSLEAHSTLLALGALELQLLLQKSVRDWC
jgi:hypothetical protein